MQKRLLLREGLELLILSAAACALLFFPETASDSGVSEASFSSCLLYTSDAADEL